VLLVSAAFARTSAAQTGWVSHTSMRSATALSAGDAAVWVASSGGIYGYDIESGEVSKLTVVEGLSGVQARSIAVDDVRSTVWVGYGDGILDRVDLDTGLVTTIRDIARADQFASRGIGHILVRDDLLYVGTDFGIVVFDPARNEVRDSYTRFGAASPAIAVRDILIGTDAGGTERIWAALPEGIASAPLSAQNLQDPSVWNVEAPSIGQNDVFSLAFNGTSLVAGTATDAYVKTSAGNWLRLGLSGEKVSRLVSLETGVLGVDPFRLLRMFATGGQQQTILDGVDRPNGIAVAGDGSVWVSDAVEGLVRVPDPVLGQQRAEPLQLVVPDGPANGDFSTLEVGTDGTLWAGGANTSNSGFHAMHPDGSWTDYISRTQPALVGRDRFLSIHVAEDGTAWAGSEGGGVVRVSEDGTLSVYDATNSPLLPATGTANFVPVNGIDGDNRGDIWITSRASGTPLYVLEDDGTWRTFGPYAGEGLTTRASAYGSIHVDSFRQKWIIVQNETNFQLVKGLMVLETGDPVTSDDDRFRYFGSAGAAGLGLPSIGVNAIAEDRDGLVWIGTDSGPAFFVNTGIVARDASSRAIWPQWADRSNGTFMLFGLRINDIAVDPANRLWFATSEGAWLVEQVEGGFRPVIQLTPDNSPMFSNEILSVAVDEATGRVFFATDRGALSFASDAVAPSSEVQDLKVFPNPLRIDGLSNPEVFIEGLVEVTEIRIVTPAGALVRRLSGRGGRIRWDARNEQGELVSSGIYLVVAVGDDDEGTAYGKIAVIH